MGQKPESFDAEICESIQRMLPAIQDHLRLEMTAEETARWIRQTEGLE
jgi:hypothetical protein